ncbi:MAG: CPA2 family monovalent cation:H+ antiporter-2 [Candidatus Aldehydirespiratoraceae bacterium]|jgi:CPA2 family monovalent cation:H+ antiporter-2
MIFAAGSTETATAFVEVGAVVFGLGLLSRLAGRIGITAVPLYLIAGLAFGDGGIAEVDVTEDFVALAAEIGVLLLLFTLGLEYSNEELRSGLRTGIPPGLADMTLNAGAGFGVGMLLGWDPLAAVLLGGVCWVSSSGVISKVLDDLGRLGNRETPAVLNLLVIEDLAMAIYLPVVAALIVGGTLSETFLSVGVALGVVATILVIALRYGSRLSKGLGSGSNESVLLGVFGVVLLVAGLAQLFDVSGAIGAFLVGLALSGRAEERALELMSPLRDLFAATFFVSFSFQINPADLVDVAGWAILLAVTTALTKTATGWYAAQRRGIGAKGRLRAGTALIARGEFSIVIAALGADLADGPELGALAAGYVLITAVLGPVMTRFSDQIFEAATR